MVLPAFDARHGLAQRKIAAQNCAMMRIRTFHRRDAAACQRVFLRAVHLGTAPHYTAAERAAWAGEDVASDVWEARLSRQWTFVAKGLRGVEGFLTLGRDGHIDFLYVLPEQRRSGLAGQLYCAAVACAQRAGLRQLDTQASHLARRFFEKRDWQVTARQSVIRNGVALTNFRMEKRL
ncbi:putative N-acetyltransferase YafP [Aquimixticola soesokkakensis]|uniref:Putative N-acetyltransferase YafP n=1 Tax=Aquimixticola soesokkakensis TaxID=1519096 RepID=A0A1Y5S2A2_9RHOB|nr:GNAT family N-acetyltransferase [Aquimixticola soesokkakensis]SLN31025.1 putative N-acetyltransferase YafP [Aquimixticola soesokkakensis]